MKRKVNLSDAERRYKTFHKWSGFILYPLLVPILILSLMICFTKDDGVLLISALLLSVWTAVVIVVCALVGKKRASLEEKLWEERNAVKRTGIFKELYDEFRHDGFEFRIPADKFLFDDCHRNTIEIGFIKYGHEFLVEIDENVVSVVIDEETDQPGELEVLLTSIASVECFYEMLNEIVRTYT